MELAQQQRELALRLCGGGPEAQALIAKRAAETAALLPATRAALGGAYAAAFRAHALRYRPCGIHRGLDDAIAFAQTLRSVPIARYECTALRAQRGAIFALLFTEHPAKPGRSTLALWWRPSAHRPLYHRLLL